MADLVFLYVRQIRDSYKNSIINDAYLINTLLGDVFVDGSLGCSSLSISHLGYFGNSVSVSTDKIKEINRNSRKIWSETLRKARLPWKQQLFLAWCETDDFNQVIENTRTIYRNQNNLVAKDNYVFKRMFWEEVIIFSTSRHFNELEYTQFKDTQQQCLKIWLQFLHELEEATDPYAKLFSCIALYEHYAGNSSQKEKYRKKIISIYRDEFHTPNEPFDTQEKYIMRYEMKRFMTIEDYAEILESLIQKKDAANLIIWSPGYASPTYSATPEATEQYYKLLEKSVEIIKDFGNAIQVLPNLSNSQVLNYILDKQLKLRQNYPNATFAIKLQTEIKANMILKVVDWAQKLSIGIHGDSDKDIKSVIYENNLWVAFMSSVNKVDEKELYLAGINLDKKELIALWQTRIPFITTPVRYETLSGISVNKDITYVSLCGSGIIEFPGSFKTGRDFIKIPVIHNQDQGIPSVFITSMTKYENKLYIAYGSRSQECGIGLYNLQNKNWECLFSSTIKGPVPFHIGNTFIVSNLTFKSKNEILFSVILPSTSYSLSSFIYNGLWKLDLTSKNLKMVVSSYMSNTEVEPVGSGEFPEKYLFKKEDHIFEFDTKSEKSKYLIGSNESINNLQTQYQNYPKTNNTKVDLMKSDFFIPESLMANFKFGLYRVGMIDLLTATIYNNKLWARYGESQIIIIEKGKSFEDAQIIDNNILDGGPVERFVSTPYGLVGIGEGTVGIIETEDMGK